jgi:putative ABC transport system substrate-binding protein
MTSVMDRRRFLLTSLAGALVTPRVARAQQAGRAPRIGVLMPGHHPFDAPATQGFRQGLRELGYVEGRTLAIEYRAAEGKPERYPKLVADLLRVPVDLIVSFSVAALPALTRATKDVPLVLATLSDPVREGYAKSFARPGGNITGLTLVHDDFLAKRLQILKEAVPRAAQVALIRNPRPGAAPADVYRAAGDRLGLTIEVFEARNAVELDGVFPLIARSGIRAVILAQDPLFGAERRRLAELGIQHRLPILTGETDFAQAGGLMNYGPSLFENFRRAATYVDKILKGARPADLPIEQAAKFDLIINMKTAKALGLTIPPSLLLQADQVIE